MAYMSAREMLSGIPLKLAKGGPVHMAIGGDVAATMPGVRADGAYTDAETRQVYNLIDEGTISADDAAQFYGATTASVDSAVDTLAAQDTALLEGEERYLADNDVYGNAAETYQTVIDSGFSVQDALDAGVAQSTINQLFTSPADTPAYAGAAPTAAMNENVQNYFDRVMADDQIDAAERLDMQEIATDQGLTFDDIVAAGVDPNMLYSTAAPAGPVAATTKVCPIGTKLAGQTIGINDDCGTIETVGPVAATTKVCPVGTKLAGQTIGINDDCGTIETVTPTTKVCPAGTILAGQTIGINQSCGIVPKTDDDDESAFGPDGETPEQKAARIAAADAARLAASIAAFDNTQDPYTSPTVYQPLPDNTSVYAAGEESLDRTFRDSAPRTEIIDAYGGLVDFDYSPGAKLTSATGSGYNFTPPTVTSRPRSLMGSGQLGRYTGGRAAADLRQMTTGLGNGRSYADYAGVLQNPGSYSGGLSKSQLYSRMRGLDYQRDAAAEADKRANAPRGGIAAYLAANTDVTDSYNKQKSRLGSMTIEQFARNHYNTSGLAEMDANKRGRFTLVESTGGVRQPVGRGLAPSLPGINYGAGGFEGEGEEYSTSNFTRAMELGEAGGVTRPVFAQGGPVKKPQGFADGGTASEDLLQMLKEAEQNEGFSVSPPDNGEPAFQDRGFSVSPPDNGGPAFQDRGFSVSPLKALDSTNSLFITNDAALAQEPTESQNIPNNILTKAATPPERSPSIARSIYNYGKDVVTAPSPSAKLLGDVMGIGMKATNDPVQYGAELLGFDDARQLSIMREAVAMTNELVDNGYLDKSSRVKLVGSTDDSSATRENVHIEGNEEVFNAVNHALFSYYAGQNPIAGLGAQIKEVKQGLQQIDRGNNPRTEYLDYFNNQFGLNLAKQGLSPEDAKYQIMANIGNIAGKGTRGRMQRGEEIEAGVDLLTNVQDARYPWE